MTRNRKAGAPEVVGAILGAVAALLLAGLVLMAFLPLLIVVGLPAQHPGFWSCTAFVVLAKALLGEAGGAWRAGGASKRK